MPKRALISVSDKTGLNNFAQGLVALGYEIYSTGGTLKTLEAAQIEAHSVSELTGFPEILDGRVKTLHPGIHAGILARRDKPSHLAALATHKLKMIDIVCVNLYPFKETAAKESASFEEVIEQIDIGGPSLLRSAAKNHQQVVVVVQPEQYSKVLSQLCNRGNLEPKLRQSLAAEAFAHTAAYDAQIANWLGADSNSFPPEMILAGQQAMALRYGENPHQSAAFYRTGVKAEGLGKLNQLQGEELSFNNLADLAAGCQLVSEYKRPTVAIIKHNNPCGLASADQLSTAYDLALKCDPISAFGGVVVLNREVDPSTAEQIIKIRTDVVAGPSITSEARAILARKSNIRVVEVEIGDHPRFDLRTVPGGFLVQSWDQVGWERSTYQVATHRQPTDEEWEQLEFAWLAAKHVKSNAIVLARNWQTVGIGAGQSSRVEAARIAIAKADDEGRGAVMASDAFFPFSDTLQLGIEAGISAVIQPGGSVRDEDSIQLANQHQIAMVMTGQRHFKH